MKKYTWNDAAKARSKKRLEYFRNYQINKGTISNRKLVINCNDSVGIVGEKFFIQSLKESIWIGKKFDAMWLGKKVDIKTSLPLKVEGRNLTKWKFSLHRQRGLIDDFVLIGLNKDKSVNSIFTIPDKELLVDSVTIIIGGYSKYSKYKISSL